MTDDEVRAKAHSLIGTAESFDTSELTATQCSIFDDICMRCEKCDWWVETDELNDDNFCRECAEV